MATRKYLLRQRKRFQDNVMMSRLISSAQFARARNVSEQRVRQLLAANKITGAVRVGSRWAVPEDAEIRRTPAGRPPRTRSGILKQAARACESALSRVGVSVMVVGSVAYGGVHAGSDLDLLVIAYPGKTWGEVSSIVADAARPYGIRVDVIFADTLPAAIRRAMLKDARRAGVL
jgi:predicted nucleotidyltransferase